MRIAAFFAACLFSGSVFAGNSVQGIPNLFNDGQSLTLPQEILGRTCYSMQAGYLDLDCNPAFLAGEEKTLFRVNLIGNDRLSQINRYRQQIANKDTVAVADDLMGRSQPTIAKVATSLWFQRDWWAIGYVPFRAGFAYAQRNPAYPEISAQAFKESELFGKAGLFSSDDHNFQIGVQGRYVQRDYLYQQFEVFEAINDPGAAVQIKQESALYIEPGIVYMWDHDLEQSFSGTYSNFPLLHYGEKLTVEPLFDFGVSSNLGAFSRALHTSFHYTSRQDVNSFASQLTWGTSYETEHHTAVNVLLGIDQFATGIQGSFSAVTLGLAYQTRKMQVDPWHSEVISTAIIDAGLVF